MADTLSASQDKAVSPSEKTGGKSAQAKPVSGTAPSAKPAQKKPQQKKRKSRLWLWLVLLLIIAVVTYIFLSWPSYRHTLATLGVPVETVDSVVSVLPESDASVSNANASKTAQRAPDDSAVRNTSSAKERALEQKNQRLMRMLEQQEQKLAAVMKQQQANAAAASGSAPFIANGSTAQQDAPTVAATQTSGEMVNTATVPVASASVNSFADAPPHTAQAMQAQMDRLTSRVNMLEQQLATVSTDGAGQFAMLATLWQVQNKAQSGQGFRYELVALKQQLLTSHLDGKDGLMDMASGLEKPARNGVKDAATLAEAFEDLAGPLVASFKNNTDSGTASNGMFNWVGNMVTVRKISADGDLPGIDGQVLRIEQALDRQDMQQVIAEAEKLANDAARLPRNDASEAFAHWLDDAKASYRVSSTLEQLFALLLAGGQG